MKDRGVDRTGPERRFDLLALENGATTELGAGLVPPGTYRAVRMVIDADSSSITLRGGRVLTAATSPGIIWQPSAGRLVLNAVVHVPLVVPSGGALLAIDFDVGRSLIPQGGDTTAPDFVVAPWARVVDADRAGAATGFGRVVVAGVDVRAGLERSVGTLVLP